MNVSTASQWLAALAKRAVKSGLLLVLATVSVAARAAPLETEHLFGFTVGTDIGEVGEREIEGSLTGRSGKQTGSYNAASGTLSAEFVPVENLRTEYAAAVNAFGIAGVSGFTDQRYGAFGGLSADFRYRLLDRATAAFGVALGASPHWDRADEVTGEPGQQYGVDFVAVADYEIVPDRIVAAFNLLYQPEAMRSKATATWSDQSMAGIAVALMARLQGDVFVGGEAQYLRRYDGLALDAFAGQGFFIGPTVYAKLSERAWIAAAFSFQVAGNDAMSTGSLDLINFERRQARLLFGISF